jgi:hypothetical protein
VNPEAELEKMMRRADAAISRTDESTRGEALDSHGHRMVQSGIVTALQRQGLPLASQLPRQQRHLGIRDNQRQVRQLAGPTTRNLPDVSYIARGTSATRGNVRVNVEVDTDTRSSCSHERTLIANDPRSMHVFFVVDRNTGEIQCRRVYDPRIRAHVTARRAQVVAPTATMPRPFVPANLRRTSSPPAPPLIRFGNR